MSSRETPGLEVLIKSILDAKGFDELQDRLKSASSASAETGESLKGAKSSAKEFQGAVEDLTGKFAEMVGGFLVGKEALGFFKDALQDAIAGEQAMQRFAAVNASVGESSAEAAEKNKAWLESMEIASGIAKDQLVPLYTKLVSSSQDVGSAQEALSVVTGAAARGMGEAGNLTDQLTRYMETGRVRGVGPLASAIRQLTAEGKTQKEVLDILSKRWGDAGASVNTSAMQVARAKVEWQEFKEQVGNLGLSLVQYLKPALEAVGYAIVAVLVGAQKLGGYIGALASSLGGFFSAFNELLHGHLTVAKNMLSETVKGLKDNFREVGKEADATAEKLIEPFTRTTEHIEQTKQAAKGWHIPITDGMKAIEQEMQKALLQAEIAGKDEIDIVNRKIAVYQSFVSRFKAGSEEQLKLIAAIKKAEQELQGLYAKDEEERIREFQRVEKNEEEAEKKAQETVKKAWAARIKAVTEGTKAQTTYVRQAMKEEMELYREAAEAFAADEEMKTYYAEKAAAIQIELDKQEIEMRKQVESAVLDSAQAIFGDSKELSIARAIINTYEGFTSALAAPYPLNLILPELVLAAGLAEVAKIASTETNTRASSTGFDDPVNDWAAQVGGRKWAADLVSHFATGASAGFSEGMRNAKAGPMVVNNTTNNAGQTRTAHYNIHMSGLFDSSSDIAMRRFVRSLRVMNTLEDQRTLR